MLPNTYPAEIWLNVLSFLSTVDVVHLSLICQQSRHYEFT